MESREGRAEGTLPGPPPSARITRVRLPADPTEPWTAVSESQWRRADERESSVLKAEERQVREREHLSWSNNKAARRIRRMIRFSVWGSGFLFYFLQWKSLTIFRTNCAISGNLPVVTRVFSLIKTRGGPGVRVSRQPGAPAESDASKQHGGDSLERCPSELGLRAR